MLELLSLTSDNDLVLAKIDDYYLCLAEPSKRNYNLNWYEANDYCKSLGKDYSLPSMNELNLIYINKEDLSLVEICLYGDEIYTLNFISIWPDRINQHRYYPWVWSSDECEGYSARIQGLFCGSQNNSSKWNAYTWILPVRRVSV